MENLLNAILKKTCEPPAFIIEESLLQGQATVNLLFGGGDFLLLWLIHRLRLVAQHPLLVRQRLSVSVVMDSLRECA